MEEIKITLKQKVDYIRETVYQFYNMLNTFLETY